MFIYQLPLRDGFDKSIQLAKELSFYWVAISISSLFICFLIFPAIHDARQGKIKIQTLKKEIDELHTLAGRYQTTKELVKSKDPFTIERLTREEFHLKRLNEEPLYKNKKDRSE